MYACLCADFPFFKLRCAQLPGVRKVVLRAAFRDHRVEEARARVMRSPTPRPQDALTALRFRLCAQRATVEGRLPNEKQDWSDECKAAARQTNAEGEIMGSCRAVAKIVQACISGWTPGPIAAMLLTVAACWTPGPVAAMLPARLLTVETCWTPGPVAAL